MPAPGRSVRRCPRSTAIRSAPSASMRSFVKPIALSTPSSAIRSRTACAIVLPATSRIVKNHRAEDRDQDRAMLPICWIKPCTNAPRVRPWFRMASFANSASMSRSLRLRGPGPSREPRTSRRAPRHTRGPRRSNRTERRSRTCRALLGAVVDAHDVELPGPVAFPRPDRRVSGTRHRSST